jgi:thioredoxin-related protein
MYCFSILGFVALAVFINGINAYGQNEVGGIIIMTVSLFLALSTIFAFFLIRKFHREGKPFAASYNIDLSLKEFYILLFKKKQCPYCNCKIRRVMKKSFISEGYDGDFGAYGNKYRVKIYYECDRCRKKIKLLELGNSPK